MRISFQRSGGRGEYELAEQSNGIDAAQAVGHDLVLRIGSAEIETDVQVTHQQGKYRLRLNGGGIQIGRQISAVLMMPKPVRDQSTLPPGARRLTTGAYIVDDIKLEAAHLSGNDLRARVVGVDFQGSGPVDASKRWAELDLIGKLNAALPGDLPNLLAQHQEMRQWGSIGTGVERLVAAIQFSLAQQTGALGIDFDEDEDPVPALLEVLHLQPPIGEPQPREPLPSEPIEIRVREVKRARGWLRRRGAATAKFSRDVRAAYRHTCVICGERFPPTHRTSSGVQAGHIMPWAGFDLDLVQNGLCLCRTHHWMVDDGLLVVEHNSETGTYQVIVPSWVAGLGEEFSVAAVQACEGPVQAERLPANPNEYPSPELLAKAARLLT